MPAPSVKSWSGHLDAIIVPASRPASFLQPAMDLAAMLDVLLVVLCSKQTQVDQVAQRIAKTARARCLIVPIPQEWNHEIFPVQTSHWQFKAAQRGRTTDLSLKRNLGLLLARLHGWHKVAFVDDDITLTRTENLGRLAGQLEIHQAAGMVLKEFPDNSVVCHARRLAGSSQDVFVSGAVLGVRCDDLPLSYFPDIYNEDWFYFAKEAAARSLPRVGQAEQAPYDPFAHPERAAWEEFGDVLAEGLFSLFGEGDPDLPLAEHLSGATSRYWERFIQVRHDVLLDTRTASSGNSPIVTPAAVGSPLRWPRWKLRKAYSPTASRPTSVSTSSMLGSRIFATGKVVLIGSAMWGALARRWTIWA